jgi:hypothetical protein
MMENRKYNSRNTKNNYLKNKQKEDKPQRRKRVNIDRDVEVVVVNNTFGRFIYSNPRISTAFDMANYGDEDYITVGELRTMVNSHRKIFENFMLLITDILDDRYTLEDLLVYLGLDKRYEEYFSMSPNWKRGQVEVGDMQQFIEKSSPQRFKQFMESVDERLRNKIIETAVALFKLGRFGDYTKMQVIRKFVNDEIFLDAEDTEIDLEI